MLDTTQQSQLALSQGTEKQRPAPSRATEPRRCWLQLVLLAAMTVSISVSTKADSEVFLSRTAPGDSADAFSSTSTSTSTIGPGAFQGTTGVISANITAGEGNIQQNSSAYAISGGYSIAGIRASQVSNTDASVFYQMLSARIETGAFANTRGISMVNQSAGIGNIQFNGAAMAIGTRDSSAFIQLSNETLGTHIASTGYDNGGGDNDTVKKEISLDPKSFNNARGVSMINQAAGSNNATANRFTLSVNP